MVFPREARKKFFHLQFSVVWMGSRSTVVFCTALSLTSASHDITERKKSTPKARYGKTNRADSWYMVRTVSMSFLSELAMQTKSQ